MPVLPFLVSSLTPSRQGPRNSHRPVPHGAKGWEKLTLPASHSIQLLPYQWVTVTMETNKFLHITGEPACQQPGLWGRQKAACSRRSGSFHRGLWGAHGG